MPKQEKKIWRKNFEIRNTHYLMATPALDDMINYQHITADKTILKEIVWVQKDYDNIATYMPREQLRGLIEKTIEVILKDPARIEKIHKKTVVYNNIYFSYSKSLLNKNFSQQSNKKIAEILNKIFQLQMLSHGYALPTTWFVDSDGEDFSKVLMGRLEEAIKASRVNLSLPEVFSILTTPEKLSLAAKEEIESFQILEMINRDKKAKRVFLQKDLEKIEKDLAGINSKIRKKIFKHYSKWRWVPYTYIGPAYNLDYYLEVWSGLLRQKIDIKKHLAEALNQAQETKNKKKEIIKKLKLSFADRRLFDIAADIIFLKSFRKDCWFLGCYAMEPLLEEAARRLNLTLKQVRFMHWREIEPALKRGYFSPDTLNKRIKFSLLYQKGRTSVIYHTDKARKFLSKLNLEKEKIKKTDKLVGTVASPGKARGKVKIINVPEEMGKMKEGDIMVAHTTFPSLVPAMKKAAAIITDDGGITCHAAIVARELKKPCVVGTKIATRFLKDGDRVEVDATKGMIKLLK